MDGQKSKVSSLNLANGFNDDVTKWRQLAAKIWSLCMIFFVLHFHCLSANYGLFNYTGLFTGFFVQLFSIRFWFYSSIILAFNWGLFAFNDKLFRVSPKVYSNNLEKLGHILNSLHSFCIISKTVSALAISSLLLKLYESNDNQNYFYIVGFCAFSSFISELKFAFDENYLLDWPIIEQTKYFRFKSQVYNLILSSIKSVIFHFLIWETIYIFGSFGISLLTLSTNNQTSISITTFLVAMKLSLVLIFSNLISWKIYEIYLTEIFHFNIQSNIHSQLSLSSAMSLNNHSYIQTLAFIDFSDLSNNSFQRRNQLFSLSLTNNQPLNWLKVSSESLNIIKDFMEAFNFDEMVHGNVLIENKTKQSLDTPNRVGNFRVSTLSPLKDRISKESTSRLKSPGFEPRNELQSIPVQSNASFIKLTEFFKKQAFLKKIYKENPNSKTQALFVDSFLVIQALKGLSNLAMKSFTEDQYGIVQQTLPEILITLIQLQKLLEKFNSTNTFTSISFKILQTDDAEYIDLMVQKLIFVLNQSIFKITQTFGSSLKSFMLSDEVMIRLKRYYLMQ